MEQTIIEATTMEVQLKEVFEQHSTRQVLFVLGASFRKQKLYGRLQELMKNAGVGCTEFSDFQPNPKYESVVAGIEALRAHHCDFIIAAGGGSAMDVAKCIKLFSEMDLSKNCLEQEIVENALPLLAIPTTAGTGSEATRFAVIYYQGNKQSVAHPSCVPGWVLMEPELLESLPMYQRKATMLDAFCQAAESVWSENSTEDSREKAAEAIRLVLKYAGSYLANLGYGQALYQFGEYKQAMEYFELSGDRAHYSEAYKEYRNEKLKKNIGLYFTSALVVAVIAVFGIKSGMFKKIGRAVYRHIRSKKRGKQG